MERNLRSDGAALSRSLVGAEVPSLTVQNGGGVLRRLANVVAPDNSTAWTNDKHNLYLNHLEVSFVSQLHESRDLVNKKPINSPEQYICWQKIDHGRDEPHSCRSVDSHNCMKNSWIYYYKNLGIHHPLVSADSHGFVTCSQQVSALNLYHANSFDSMKEGTGQNYVNEDNDKPNLRSRVEKIKTAKADGSSHE